MMPLVVAAGCALWESAWWARRKTRRADRYKAARVAATGLGRPLVVVGAPDRGMTAGYGAGDIVLDIGPSALPNAVQCDICQPIPIPTDSVVVFVACVLEYVDDAEAAWRELTRISGGRVYLVRVEPWTFAAYLYPGARRTV